VVFQKYLIPHKVPQLLETWCAFRSSTISAQRSSDHQRERDLVHLRTQKWASLSTTGAHSSQGMWWEML